jgi:hypothetical protein
MEMKHGHEAWSCSNDIQQQYAAYADIDMQYGHAAWTNSVEMQLGIKHRQAAK